MELRPLSRARPLVFRLEWTSESQEGLSISTQTWAYPRVPTLEGLGGPQKDLDHEVLKGSRWVLKPLSQHHILRTRRVDDSLILLISDGL